MKLYNHFYSIQVFVRCKLIYNELAYWPLYNPWLFIVRIMTTATNIDSRCKMNEQRLKGDMAGWTDGKQLKLFNFSNEIIFLLGLFRFWFIRSQMILIQICSKCESMRCAKKKNQMPDWQCKNTKIDQVTQSNDKIHSNHK